MVSTSFVCASPPQEGGNFLNFLKDGKVLLGNNIFMLRKALENLILIFGCDNLLFGDNGFEPPNILVFL